VHNPGGYNFEPLQFYYSGHKGWCLVEDDFDAQHLEAYIRKGSTYLVSKATGMLQKHPQFMQLLRSRYQIVREEPDILIVKLTPASG
jgi:hypothetical protein